MVKPPSKTIILTVVTLMKGIQNFNVIFTKQFIFFFISTFTSFISMQFVYAQTAENEIIENTLNTVEKATAGISEITESLNNISESANNNANPQVSQQIEDNATNIDNTESAEQPISLIFNKNENLTNSIYENSEMGIQLKYPLNGYIEEHIHDCQQDLCWIEIFLESSSEHEIEIWSYPQRISKIPFFEISLPFPQQINTLLDFAKDRYFKLSGPGFKYINDNQTTVSNNPAIQMEYINFFGRSSIEIITQNNNFFYSIRYGENEDLDTNEYKTLYTNYVKDVKEIINSIAFENGVKSQIILKEIIPISTNTTFSTERGYPSFINSSDLEHPEIKSRLNDTQNFREKLGDLSFHNSTIGIKFIYPSNWYLFFSDNFEDCYKEICKFSLMETSRLYHSNSSYIDVTTLPLINYTSECNCTNIVDYIKSIYDSYWQELRFRDFEFFTDKFTTIDNHTAIQMEFVGKKGSDDESRNYVYLITNISDIFYQIEYYISDENYRKHFPQIKKIIDSIQFIEMDKPKRPSFM